MNNMDIYNEIEVQLHTGTLFPDELARALEALPIDITFIDNNDRIKFFNHGQGRVFGRAPSVIGRDVRDCHPEKSREPVNRLLARLKEEESDYVDFWLRHRERLIYIRYIPVRNGSGEYIGCLEVTEDITQLQDITGEKISLE